MTTRSESKLKTIAESLRSGGDEPTMTVRTFLSWFGAQRRGYWIVAGIREELTRTGVTTDPDFESAYIDSVITLKLAPIEGHGDAVVEVKASGTGYTDAMADSDDTTDGTHPYLDPTHSISKLEAANTPPTFVSPSASLEEAVTLMLTHEYSQLPVMTTLRDVKGIISWSSIGSRLALGKAGKESKDFMEPAFEILWNASIFQAVPLIVQHNYVLVRAHDRTISGIVTATDLGEQFGQLAQPFLLLGEIENHIRQIIGSRFTTSELAAARDPSDQDREVTRPADLSFGEYIRLLEDPKRWAKLKINIDRGAFCKNLDEVRRVRNDVMHFDPDGIPQKDEELLLHFSRFLRRLHTMGVC